MAQPQFTGLNLDRLLVDANTTTEWGRRGRLRFRNLLDIFTRDAEWSSLLLSHPNIEDGNDDSWLPQRPLG